MGALLSLAALNAAAAAANVWEGRACQSFKLYRRQEQWLNTFFEQRKKKSLTFIVHFNRLSSSCLVSA